MDLNGDITAWATLMIGGVGFAAAIIAGVQLRRGRIATELSIRPLLSDVRVTAGADQQAITFGAPGRISVRLYPHTVYVHSESGFHASVPFRNTGAGVAVITGASTDRDPQGDVQWTHSIVPVGREVRVNVSGQADSEAARAWASVGQFVVGIRYTDANGGQPLETKAYIATYATSGVLLEKIAVFRKLASKPFIESGLTHSPPPPSP